VTGEASAPAGDSTASGRGRVTEWLEGDTAWEIIDQIATKYTGQPYTRDKERIVAVVEPDQQTIGIG
jgi:hypothetical protein